MPGDSDTARLNRMLELPMTTLRFQVPPAITLDELDDVAYFHGQLFCKISGTRRSSVSLCRAWGRASSQAAFSSDTGAATTRLPSTKNSTWLEVVWPMDSAVAPHFTATSWIRLSFSESQEMTTRLASSPKSRYSGARPSDLSSTRAPRSRGKPASAM